MTRANTAWVRRREWHAAALRAAPTPSRRLAVAFDWLRAEARLAGPDVIEQVTTALLAQAGQLHQAANPTPTTSEGRRTDAPAGYRQ